ALLGRRDLPLSPDPRAGFEMVLLRMLAFKPQGVPELPSQPLPGAGAQPKAAPQVTEPGISEAKPAAPVPQKAEPQPQPAPASVAAPQAVAPAPAVPASAAPVQQAP